MLIVFMMLLDADDRIALPRVARLTVDWSVCGTFSETICAMCLVLSLMWKNVQLLKAAGDPRCRTAAIAFSRASSGTVVAKRSPIGLS